MPNTWGYARVSSTSQNLNRQLDALVEAGVPEENIFTDEQSGKDFNRPGYKQLISSIKKGDLIIIKSIDRLGRSYDEIINQWRHITKELEVNIRVLDMPLLDTTYADGMLGTFISDLVLQIFSFQAEQERTFIKQRQAEGIAAARKRGVHLGRPKKNLPSNFDELYARFKNGESVASLSKDCAELSESTLRLRLKEMEQYELANFN